MKKKHSQYDRQRSGFRQEKMSYKCYRNVTISAACLLVLSCDSATAPENRVPPGVETDGTSFQLEDLGSWYSGNIPYTFTNRTGGAVYFPNCHGTFDIGLERKERGGWREVWRPVLAACLSAPIVIQPDSVYRRTLRLVGAAPGNNNAYPRFRRLDLPGTYRLVLIDALSSYQDRLPWGEPIELVHRASNEFHLSLD